MASGRKACSWLQKGVGWKGQMGRQERLTGEFLAADVGLERGEVHLELIRSRPAPGRPESLHRCELWTCTLPIPWIPSWWGPTGCPGPRLSSHSSQLWLGTPACCGQPVRTCTRDASPVAGLFSPTCQGSSGNPCATKNWCSCAHRAAHAVGRGWGLGRGNWERGAVRGWG